MFDSWVGKIPWRRAWQPTPVFLPEGSHGQRHLAGYGPVHKVAKSWMPLKQPQFSSVQSLSHARLFVTP